MLDIKWVSPIIDARMWYDQGNQSDVGKIELLKAMTNYYISQYLGSLMNHLCLCGQTSDCFDRNGAF